MRRPFVRCFSAVLVLLLAGTATYAQFRFGDPIRRPGPDSFDGAFNFCRIEFRGVRGGDGGGWGVDYARADENLSIRLSELTKTPISISKDTDGPNHLVIRLTDPALFRCPFIMMTEVGSMFLDEDEAARLREYLLKGGFLWADDFWGSFAWEVWDSQIRKALPSGPFRTIDLPTDHPLFRTFFHVKKVPQISSINFWRGTGGTSERGADSAIPRARAIVDDRDRMLVFITHNTDIGDSFEHEGSDREYFINFSVDGYALGINVLVYAMSH